MCVYIAKSFGLSPQRRRHEPSAIHPRSAILYGPAPLDLLMEMRNSKVKYGP